MAVAARLREIGKMDWGLQDEEEQQQQEGGDKHHSDLSSSMSLGGLTTLSTVASMVATVGEAHLPAQLID